MRLCDGTEIKIGGAGDDVIGIGADLEVSVGYDSLMSRWPQDEDHYDEPIDGDLLTTGQKIMICDEMISRWSALRAKLLGHLKD
jgi:hypothetical protein